MTTTSNTTILIIEDDQFVRHSLAVYLGSKGYTILQAENGRVGLEIFFQKNPDLVLLDLRMPELDGLEVLAALAQQIGEVPVIIISGVGSREDAIESLRLGAWDFLVKPIRDMTLLEHSVNKALERAVMIRERHRYQQELEKTVADRTAELRHRETKLKKALVGIVDVVAAIVEKRDPYTAGHEQRVASLARAIAREMGLTSRKIEGLHLAAIIHDLGKVAIPSELLSKPGRLTDLEFQFIQTHVQVGYDILRRMEFPWPLAQIVHQHHERLDGSGYPQGLKDGEIMIEARILGVADVVEAMSSHRPYRPALGIDTALEEINRHRGTLYDADVVEACHNLFGEGRFIF
ncbi:two-component system response regulator [Desulfolithobacter dissulfuricans]|uniref:Two-component system response regulator n=1 Tax=Desulfolithobacter dissulfuricans TaxID=2795293 RepID=A0A915TZL7_9BACT|nr:HD domain-containing phosphohydrolase [Desulfolithobacter dissulfuricans]BCO08229.1 two-component system response regulator [Desulfolithobacter dissulfuricans]